MGSLFARIRQLVADEDYLIGEHAHDRLDERGIVDWQVIESLRDGKLLAERPDSRPNPTVEVEQILPDGTAIKAVWAYLKVSECAKLVTAHYFD